ncbi:PTS system D-mannitol-specific IIA component, Fru family [Pelagirhabdus alkalitolerans]|uniref:Mannitol-specific phosphotransferase enzyme IIA component n=1 Tax=Pelagirhabdus alkalitolerans TaxID=1612202 RepID=A0A1G6K0X4_9BACI|nr:PTS sugar transporter subunit IIA [Pelagirhabdus alkalitolerans]SDC23926.1 PTS system D-mannitol-specific IIA component, Fru family [Pelagirhabdus alkalitolerans]
MAKEILTKENVILGATLSDKEKAIRYTGQILVDNGYVDELYVDKMVEREQVATTYMGNNVAIPHGTEDAKKAVKETGLSVVICPQGVDFNGNTVNILIGIAGKGDEHLEVLSKIALVCADEDNIQTLIKASSKEEIIEIFSGVN